MSVYHISVYFDEKTTAHMQEFIEKVAQATGNHYMTEAKVPPHITLCALECGDEEALKAALESVFGKVQHGTLQWVSVGTFLPGVIFLQPVLNKYLQGLMETVYGCVQDFAEGVPDSAEAAPGCARTPTGVKIKPCYKPFSWLPHSTIAKKLTPRELQAAFEVLQKEFGVFEGEVVRIGLSKMNPHREIAGWALDK